MLTEKFLTVEGIEGVGKSTAVAYIKNYLDEHHQSVTLTREPGGTNIAEQIRKIVLTPEQERITLQAELLLMFASRAQHIEHVILPALKKGDWVVCDRYIDASYAYQGGGREISLTAIEYLDRWIVNQLYPRVTILLDAPPEIGLMRAKARGEHDRIEQEKVDFFERVRAVYLSRAKNASERFYVIDATQSLAKVQESLNSILDSLVSYE